MDHLPYSCFEVCNSIINDNNPNVSFFFFTDGDYYGDVTAHKNQRFQKLCHEIKLNWNVITAFHEIEPTSKQSINFILNTVD